LFLSVGQLLAKKILKDPVWIGINTLIASKKLLTKSIKFVDR
jgi:hypothetical protein